jgi:hypothetical protein
MFKVLRKKVCLEVGQHQSRLFEILHSKPFWIWNVEEHKSQYTSIFSVDNAYYKQLFQLPNG